MPVSLEELIVDPRGDPAFPSQVRLPGCDGGEWPEANAVDPVARQQIEFLAMYSHLNRLRHALNDARHRGMAKRELEAAKWLHRAIEFRDRLEDRYAPVGFFAEPVMGGDFCSNLVFHYARKVINENHRQHEPQDVTVKVPLPSKELMKATASAPGIPVEKILADLSWRPRWDEGGKPLPAPKR